MKKIFFFPFIFSLVFAFSPMPYNKIKKIAEETNIKLFGKQLKQQKIPTYHIDIISKQFSIKKKNNVNVIKKDNINSNKKNKKTTYKIAYKTKKSINIKNINIQNNKTIIISHKRKKQTLKIFKLPYLKFEQIVKQIIGAPNDMADSLCRVVLPDEKETIEPCSSLKKYISERNRLLDEFASNLLKFKADIAKNKTYYRGYFNCGLLYRYYSYEHYADCDKLMNMLSQKEKQNLYNYVKFILKY